MNQREQAVMVARSTIGEVETGVNIQRFSQWQAGANVEWCASHACWCMFQAGVRFPPTAQFGERGWAWTPSISAYYASVGAYDKSPLPGDFGIRADRGHTTFVEFVDAAGVHTIEGNDRNAVRQEVHPVSWFHGFGHVAYGEIHLPASPPVDADDYAVL